MSLAEGCKCRILGKIVPKGTTRALEAAEVETPSATTQTPRQVVIYIEQTYEYRMFNLIQRSILVFVPKAADTFARPTSFLIIKRQQLGGNGSASPLVVVENGHGLPDGAIECVIRTGPFTRAMAKNSTHSLSDRRIPYEQDVNHAWLGCST